MDFWMKSKHPDGIFLVLNYVDSLIDRNPIIYKNFDSIEEIIEFSIKKGFINDVHSERYYLMVYIDGKFSVQAQDKLYKHHCI